MTVSAITKAFIRVGTKLLKVMADAFGQYKNNISKVGH